ncbi:MAG: TetR/AcrR family transcriptional regulator [Desulfobacterales bacterium]|nr:TetR/AcrR family transcriptional regulator [Desulfobacterales bacterium]
MTATDRKAWEKTQRENRIIDIAQEVFVSRGYEGATVPAIADAAGYNKRTIYLYFRDKEEIFLAVVLRCLQLLKAGLETATELVPEAKSGLREFAWAVFSFSEDYPEFMDLIMLYESRHFVYHEADKPDHYGKRHAACQAVSDEISDMVTAEIEKGIARGVLVTDLAPRQLMLLLWGQIFGVIQILRIRQKHFEGVFGLSRDQLFNHFVDQMQTALSKQ